MDNLTILLLALGILAVLSLVWYAVREIQNRLRWSRMWEDLRDITDMDEGRERWHQFLREDGREDKIALPEMEKMFQGIWKDTMDKRDDRDERKNR